MLKQDQDKNEAEETAPGRGASNIQRRRKEIEILRAELASEVYYHA